MEVRLNNLRGLEDAMVSLFQSKGTYTKEFDKAIRESVLNRTGYNGFIEPSYGDEIPFTNPINKKEYTFDTLYNMVLNIGVKHTTILRYIDFSFNVIGLHRGAQDDLDAHAHRFNNRIIRSSTRLSSFDEYNKSEYYKDKILTVDDVVKQLAYDMPEEIEFNGVIFVKCVNGEKIAIVKPL